MKKLTKKEEVIMNLFWDNGPMYVRELHDIYPEPKPHFNTPCLNYHIGKCMAPCLGTVSSDDYRAMIGQIVAFFEGKYDGIEKDIKESFFAL